MAEATTSLKDEFIGIVGSGLIGRNWAMIFASAGYLVRLYDINEEQVRNALTDIRDKLQEMERQEILRGFLGAEQQSSRITGASSLEQCIQGAKFVQECVPENLELKQKIFSEMDKVVGETTVLSSSSSTIPASAFTESLTHRHQCLISHPINPPLHCPLVEVVPTPWTHTDIISITMTIMKEVGQSPVLLKKEVPGFAVNRIQYALLMECWRLVQDDIISVEDVDKVMTEGLGMRYAFIGPMETCHLNADGMKDYCERYGQAIFDVSSTFGPNPRMGGEMAAKIHSELEKKIPVDKIPDRRQWRDSRLIALSRVKKEMNAKDD